MNKGRGVMADANETPEQGLPPGYQATCIKVHLCIIRLVFLSPVIIYNSLHPRRWLDHGLQGMGGGGGSQGRNPAQ